ncbi:hypothetical protein TVAG_252590 [Trichomonas vaginalis G3]|uniref:Uncharacterized protein n=1 Tax=Trichomonas vaginalis (strain ATCC PRA-98 / G3) TaxID=412133 RepID=A2DW01_TRIV3|nr:armadillo (ARM) repeat-containing protein family [Trichomonas vaginalis G3]EAY15446.1 hypothetical protein TVAG_252590 [Trichomonas vaginalis G3]KAI5499569.1 armadillo (ARM) repeat-containing protein family [Trichomonas vaginalis G3]|eukprot:XP_001327669.1 hypothetical protein [Trichomonas vaginalis G3]
MISQREIDRDSSNDMRVTARDVEQTTIGPEISKEEFMSALENCNIPENFEKVEHYLNYKKFISEYDVFLPNLIALLDPQQNPDPDFRLRVFNLFHQIINDFGLYYDLIYKYNFHEFLYQLFPEEGSLVLLEDLLYYDSTKYNHDTEFRRVFLFLMDNNFCQRIIELLSNYTNENIQLLIHLIRVLTLYNANDEVEKYLNIADKLVELLGSCTEEGILGKFIINIGKIQIAAQYLTQKYIENDDLFNFLLSFPPDSDLNSASLIYFHNYLLKMQTFRYDDSKFERLMNYCFQFITDDSKFLGDACYFFATAIQYAKTDDEKYTKIFFESGWFDKIFEMAKGSYSYKIKEDLTNCVLSFIDSTRNLELMMYMIDNGVIDFIELCIDSMPRQITYFIDAIYRILEVASANQMDDWKCAIFNSETISEAIYSFNPRDQVYQEIIELIRKMDQEDE